MPEPIRRLGEIADLLLLGLSMAILAVWQETTEPLSRDANFVIMAMLFLYLAFAMHLKREGGRAAPPVEPDSPRAAQQAKKRGRPRGIPTGHTAEAAYRKGCTLDELRSQGYTWEEAARHVGLSVRQAQHLHAHYRQLAPEKDE